MSPEWKGKRAAAKTAIGIVLIVYGGVISAFGVNYRDLKSITIGLALSLFGGALDWNSSRDYAELTSADTDAKLARIEAKLDSLVSASAGQPSSADLVRAAPGDERPAGAAAVAALLLQAGELPPCAAYPPPPADLPP